MDKQTSFSEWEYNEKKKLTRRDVFLNRVETLVPWQEWLALIEPHYPKGERGRPPIGCERMLRLYLLQTWYNLTDEGMEDAVYDSQALRKFSRIDLTCESAPDATTILKFRHLLENLQLPKPMFEELHIRLRQSGLFIKEGTIVDAVLIETSGVPRNVRQEKDETRRATKAKSERGLWD